MSRYTPKRGDIINLSFDPALGREQQGKRPALVLSPAEFNRFGVALVCPITQGGNFSRGKGWTVSLQGCGTDTQGVALCNQIRTIDWQERRAKYIETVPDYITDEVLARVVTLLE